MTIKVGNFSGNKKIDEKHEDVAETKPPRLNMSFKTIFIIFMLPQVFYWILQIYKFGWTQELTLQLIFFIVTTISVIFNIGEIMAIFVLSQLRYYAEITAFMFQLSFNPFWPITVIFFFFSQALFIFYFYICLAQTFHVLKVSYKKRFAMIVKKKKMQPLYDV